MKATLIQIVHETHDRHTYWFKPDKPYEYLAGQFAEVSFPETVNSDRTYKRWFTLSSSPTEPNISFTTKHAASDVSRYKQLLQTMELGTQMEFSDAMGDFVLPKDTTIPLVFIVGGIGITPIRSMIKFLDDTRDKRNIQLFYGVRNKEDAIFTDELKKYGIVSLISTKDKHKYFNAQDITSLMHAPQEAYIYCSGPEEMVEKLMNDFMALGQEQNRLIGDYFPGYPLR